MVLCFVLGMGARFLKSDLSLPESVYTALSTYLLLAIGLKGGVALSQVPLITVAWPAVGTLFLGVLIPLVVFLVARRIGNLDVADSGALAAHYGSVSAVTFIAALAFLQIAQEPVEGFLPALVAVLEIPAIVVGLFLARPAMAPDAPLKEALNEIITGKSVVLLAGGMLIGFAAGPRGWEDVQPFFGAPFKGALCLFLLDMGLLAAGRLAEVKRAGVFLVFFAILAPVIQGALGLVVGKLAGLSLGGATVLAAMAASASYIAAPAAVRIALPQANPALYLTGSVGITFPFNLALGIPLYYNLGKALYTMG
jgi:hypothetical protein